MRIALLPLAFALAAGGCNDDNHRLESLESSVAELAKMKAEVSHLQAQLAAIPEPVDLAPLRSDLDALKTAVAAIPPPFDAKPITDRLDAIEAKIGMGGAAKTPHLIVDKTGEDLGQLVAGNDVVWSAKVKGEVAVTTLVPVSFEQAQCMGPAAVKNQRAKAFINTATGHLYRPNADFVQVVSESYMDNLGNCHDVHDVFNGLPVVDTGQNNIIFPVDTLHLELR